jgi:hypothetical protein
MNKIAIIASIISVTLLMLKAVLSGFLSVQTAGLLIVLYIVLLAIDRKMFTILAAVASIIFFLLMFTGGDKKQAIQLMSLLSYLFILISVLYFLIRIPFSSGKK